MAVYAIFDVSSWPGITVEALGTKKKDWLQGPSGERWLFKHPRAGTGEHWSERIVSEVAAWLPIPHAAYELAVRNGNPGVIVRDFTDDLRRGELVLGNALLHAMEPAYEKDRKKPVQHTVDAAIHVLSGVSAGPMAQSPEIESAADVFVGYLMLDALVGNTDRHHENWGLLERIGAEESELAPTFDHASSLGRELSDGEREKRLTTRDAGFDVEAYCAKAKSPLFSTSDPPRPLRVRDAFERAAVLRPRAAGFWLRRLAARLPGLLHEAVAAVPENVMTEPARRFARGVLECNRRFLLSLLSS